MIVGGESGSKARPMHPDWARSLRDQSVTAGVPFHFKQWGEWAPNPKLPGGYGCMVRPGDLVVAPDGQTAPIRDDFSCELEARGTAMRRVGRVNAGRLLDGREWNDVPDLPKVAA